MNRHLQKVREFHGAFALPQAQAGESGHLSDMDIILHQALLMEAGGAVFRAMKHGEMAEILGGMADLAYQALSVVAMRGEEVSEKPVTWRHDGSVISIMRLLSDKINHCAAGDTAHYSEVYCVCAQLASSFLNADFDKAMQVLHASYMDLSSKSATAAYRDAGEIRRSALYKTPDFSDCLYE